VVNAGLLRTIGWCALATVSLVVCGCFVAEAPQQTSIACADPAACPPTHRCELSLGRCLPADETVPQATTLTASTDEDTPIDIVLAGTDADGDTLAFSVTPPDAAEGTLGEVVGDRVTFTPAPDFSGTATFAFVVQDDAGLVSAPSTVTVSVTPVDDPPFFDAPTQLLVDEDQPLQINVDLFDRPADGRDAETLQVIDVDTFELGIGFAGAEPGAVVTQQPDGDIVYLPPRDFSGPDDVEVTARCGGQTTTHPLQIVVVPVNDVPTVEVSDLSTREGETVERPVALTDVDDPPDQLTVEVAEPSAAIGAVFVVDDVDDPTARRLRFVPSSIGEATVTVRVTDAAGAQVERSVGLQVFATVAAPEAGSATRDVAEDDFVLVDLAGLSRGPDGLSWGIQAIPLHGTLDVVRLSSGQVTYRPAPDYFGADRFVYSVNAPGSSTSVVGAIDIVVTPRPDRPGARDQRLTVVEDQAFAGAIDAFDPDGDALVATVASPPLHGTFDVVGLEFVYTPGPDFAGRDTVDVLVDDDRVGEGALARLTIDVVAVPDVPDAADLVAEAREDETTPITLAGDTVDADAVLEHRIVTGPQHGAVVMLDEATGRVAYTPARDYFGPDGFEYAVRTAGGTSRVAHVAVTVRAVADLPVIAPLPEVVVAEDDSVLVPVVSTDADGEPVAVEVATRPRFGDARIDPDGALVYTPHPDEHGVDVVGLSPVSQERGAIVEVRVRVIPVPDAPVAQGVLVPVVEDQSTNLVLDGTSVDDESLVFEVVEVPAHGALSAVGADGRVVYTPTANFFGVDSFRYVARDTRDLVSTPAEVRLTVSAVDEAPVINVRPIVVDEDGAIDAVLDIVDVDGDLVGVDVGAAAHGRASIQTDARGVVLRYEPAPEFHGVDRVAVTARDAAGLSTTAEFGLTVVARPDTPTARPFFAESDEDRTVAVLLEGSSVDGDALRFVIVAQPEAGRVIVNGATGAGAFTPPADFSGTATFDFVVVNTAGMVSAPARATIVLLPVNDPPTLELPGSVITAEDFVVDVPLTVVDADGDPVTLELVTNGIRGTATVLPGTTTLRYTPRADENGSDVVVVAARDAASRGASSSIAITILPVPDPPRANPVTSSAFEDASALVQLSGSSADREAVTFSIVTSPSRGVIEGFNPTTGAVLYRGGANFNGTDSFVFTASTATQTGTSATATIVVQPINDPPTLFAPAVTVDVPRDLAGTSPSLSADDIDGEAVGLVIVQQPPAGSASVVGGAIAYQAPRADSLFVGDVEVVVVAVDASGAQSPPVAVPFRVVVDDDCASLRNSGVTASGLYAIRQVEARCDMSTDGGGWTMVAKVVDRWRYDDDLWGNDETLNADDLDALPIIDAKLAAWRFMPPPDAVRIETFDSSLQGRQRIVLDVSGAGSLVELFSGGLVTTTAAGIASWRATFAPREVGGSSFACVREGANLTNRDVESAACRLCAFGSPVPANGDQCVGATQAYGLGVESPFFVNAGAGGAFDERRRAVLWVRSADFSANFPDGKSCEEHGRSGRVLSGLYSVQGIPTFCTF
jgi:hypothetical protein